MSRNRFDIFAGFERMMTMDDAAWARHANPLSIYTRIPILPLLSLAIFSRVWLGWLTLLAVALVLLWTWLNPRAFAPPAHTESWAARGTFGERVFLNRARIPIPPHHARWGIALAGASALGFPPWLYGLWALDAGWLLFGLTLLVGAKLWFVDRMGWLYQDMHSADPAYTAWHRPRPGSASPL